MIVADHTQATNFQLGGGESGSGGAETNKCFSSPNLTSVSSSFEADVWESTNDDLIERGIDKSTWLDESGRDFNTFMLFKARSGQFVTSRENLSNHQVCAAMHRLFSAVGGERRKTPAGVSTVTAINRRRQNQTFSEFLSLNPPLYEDDTNQADFSKPFSFENIKRFIEFHRVYKLCQMRKYHFSPHRLRRPFLPSTSNPGSLVQISQQPLRRVKKRFTIDIFSNEDLNEELSPDNEGNEGDSCVEDEDDRIERKDLDSSDSLENISDILDQNQMQKKKKPQLSDSKIPENTANSKSPLRCLRTLKSVESFIPSCIRLAAVPQSLVPAQSLRSASILRQMRTPSRENSNLFAKKQVQGKLLNQSNELIVQSEQQKSNLSSTPFQSSDSTIPLISSLSPAFAGELPLVPFSQLTSQQSQSNQQTLRSPMIREVGEQQFSILPKNMASASFALQSFQLPSSSSSSISPIKNIRLQSSTLNGKYNRISEVSPLKVLEQSQVKGIIREQPKQTVEEATARTSGYTQPVRSLHLRNEERIQSNSKLPQQLALELALPQAEIQLASSSISSVSATTIPVDISFQFKKSPSFQDTAFGVSPLKRPLAAMNFCISQPRETGNSTGTGAFTGFQRVISPSQASIIQQVEHKLPQQDSIKQQVYSQLKLPCHNSKQGVSSSSIDRMITSKQNHDSPSIQLERSSPFNSRAKRHASHVNPAAISNGISSFPSRGITLTSPSSLFSPEKKRIELTSSSEVEVSQLGGLQLPRISDNRIQTIGDLPSSATAHLTKASFSIDRQVTQPSISASIKSINEIATASVVRTETAIKPSPEGKKLASTSRNTFAASTNIIKPQLAFIQALRRQQLEGGGGGGGTQVSPIRVPLAEDFVNQKCRDDSQDLSSSSPSSTLSSQCTSRHSGNLTKNSSKPSTKVNSVQKIFQSPLTKRPNESDQQFKLSTDQQSSFTSRYQTKKSTHSALTFSQPQLSRYTFLSQHHSIQKPISVQPETSQNPQFCSVIETNIQSK